MLQLHICWQDHTFLDRPSISIVRKERTFYFCPLFLFSRLPLSPRQQAHPNGDVKPPFECQLDVDLNDATLSSPLDSSPAGQVSTAWPDQAHFGSLVNGNQTQRVAGRRNARNPQQNSHECLAFSASRLKFDSGSTSSASLVQFQNPTTTQQGPLRKFEGQFNRALGSFGNKPIQGGRCSFARLI